MNHFMLSYTLSVHSVNFLELAMVYTHNLNASQKPVHLPIHKNDHVPDTDQLIFLIKIALFILFLSVHLSLFALLQKQTAKLRRSETLECLTTLDHGVCLSAFRSVFRSSVYVLSACPLANYVTPVYPWFLHLIIFLFLHAKDPTSKWMRPSKQWSEAHVHQIGRQNVKHVF